ncbi:MAG: septum formation initiator family protein [Patescibacteria group bacterium]
MSKLKQFKYILLTALFFALSVGFIRSTFNILKSKERLDDVQKEVAEMGKQVRDLNVDIEYKKTDAYIEEKARNDLNMIRPGEQVYVVVDSGKNESSSEVLGTQKKSEKERDSSKDTNWYAWYKLFF